MPDVGASLALRRDGRLFDGATDTASYPVDDTHAYEMLLGAGGAWEAISRSGLAHITVLSLLVTAGSLEVRFEAQTKGTITIAPGGGFVLLGAPLTRDVEVRSASADAVARIRGIVGGTV